MKRFLKIVLWIFIILFAFCNYIAIVQAYKFTHFTSEKVTKTKSTDSLSFGKKLKLILTGVSNPRPKNDTVPSQKFEIIKLQSNKTIECWYIKTVRAKATIIICHGYSGDKASMLDKAKEFIGMGYNTLLLDFMGSGGSEGNQTTIGYKEAEEIKTCYDYVQKRGEKNIFLFGTSMGAASILKTMHDYTINPAGIILECPFGNMYQAITNRFQNMGVPVFPFAGMLTFWGGVENGFWAFSYSPAEYAKSVKCPTLLMYGGKDKKVNAGETLQIYSNLTGKKTLVVFPNAGHDNYLKEYEAQWADSVHSFTNRYIKIDTTALSDTSDLSYFKPIWGYRFNITGNFTGSGRIDTLTEHYYSQVRHRETNKFFDSVAYDDMVSLAIEQSPWSFVTSINHKLDTLQISKDNGQLFGIAWIKNEGDLLGDGKDEISYVIDWADWSSINTCHIMTYTNHGWKELYSFMVHDWEIPALPNYQVNYGLFGADGGQATNNNSSAAVQDSMKKFSGFIKRVKPGIILVHTWTFDATDTILKVNLINHTPHDSNIDAAFPKD